MFDGGNLLWTKDIAAAIGSPGETQVVLGGLANCDQVTMQSIFAYGSNGTTVKAWLQTSFDNGTTWVDIASHAFATTAATKISSVTAGIAPASQAFAPADGALSDNTVVNGVIGDRLRVKVITAGTYAGATSLNVWVSARRRAI